MHHSGFMQIHDSSNQLSQIVPCFWLRKGGSSTKQRHHVSSATFFQAKIDVFLVLKSIVKPHNVRVVHHGVDLDFTVKLGLLLAAIQLFMRDNLDGLSSPFDYISVAVDSGESSLELSTRGIKKRCHDQSRWFTQSRKGRQKDSFFLHFPRLITSFEHQYCKLSTHLS